METFGGGGSRVADRGHLAFCWPEEGGRPSGKMCNQFRLQGVGLRG